MTINCPHCSYPVEVSILGPVRDTTAQLVAANNHTDTEGRRNKLVGVQRTHEQVPQSQEHVRADIDTEEVLALFDFSQIEGLIPEQGKGLEQSPETGQQ